MSFSTTTFSRQVSRAAPALYPSGLPWRFFQYIEIGKKEATLVAGGKTVGNKGYFIEPTIFANAPEDSKIMREEIFGPVVASGYLTMFYELTEPN